MSDIPFSAPAVAVGAVVIERGEGGPRVLLVKRATPPRIGQWSLPGGRVEPGERLVDAVAREVLEESGLLVRVDALVEVAEILDAPFHYVILDYLCERMGGELLAGSDVSDVAMAGVDELQRYGVTDAVARVVGKAIAMVG